MKADKKRLWSLGLLLATGIASQQASASLYEIICVECTLVDSGYILQDSFVVVDSGPTIFPTINGDFDFDILGTRATAYNSAFYYNPGTYTFDSVGDIVTPGQSISMTVNPGQIGMFFQFEWNGNMDIDVLNVFDVNYNGFGEMTLTPTDVDGNGVAGFAMVEGPWLGYDLAMNFTVATPVPASVWLFASGLVSLLHFARRKRAFAA